MRLKSSKDGSLVWWHWLVISLSVTLTFTAWHISKAQIESKIEQRFEFQANQLLVMISERMSHYENALRSGVAVINSSNFNLDHVSWNRFVSVMKSDEIYLGINGIGVIYKIDRSEVRTFIQQQQQTRPTFNIHPQHNEKELLPITYLYPLVGNV